MNEVLKGIKIQAQPGRKCFQCLIRGGIALILSVFLGQAQVKAEQLAPTTHVLCVDRAPRPAEQTHCVSQTSLGTANA